MKTLSATTPGITRALIVKLWGNADIYNPNLNFVWFWAGTVVSVFNFENHFYFCVRHVVSRGLEVRIGYIHLILCHC